MRLSTLRLLARLVFYCLIAIVHFSRRRRSLPIEGGIEAILKKWNSEPLVDSVFRATKHHPRMRVFVLAVTCEGLMWGIRRSANLRLRRAGAIRNLNPDEFAIQQARRASLSAAVIMGATGEFVNNVLRRVKAELPEGRVNRVCVAVDRNSGETQHLFSSLSQAVEVRIVRAQVAELGLANHRLFDAILTELGYFNSAPQARGLNLSRDRIGTFLDLWAGFLPIRIANEDLGEFVEDINRRIDAGQRVMPYVQTVSALFWTAINTVGYLKRNLR